MDQKCAVDSIWEEKTLLFLSQEPVVYMNVSMKRVCGDQAGATPNMINPSGVLNAYIVLVKSLRNFRYSIKYANEKNYLYYSLDK